MLSRFAIVLVLLTFLNLYYCFFHLKVSAYVLTVLANELGKTAGNYAEYDHHLMSLRKHLEIAIKKSLAIEFWSIKLLS